MRDLNLPLPIPFNPGSRRVFVGSRLFAFFRLQNIVQCCIIFLFFLLLPATLEITLPAPSSSSFPPPVPLHLEEAQIVQQFSGAQTFSPM